MTEAMPHILGLSHNAEGQTRRSNGREVLEEIGALHSVDLVCNPATTSGLFEGTQMSDLEQTRRAWAATGYTLLDALTGKVSPALQLEVEKVVEAEGTAVPKLPMS